MKNTGQQCARNSSRSTVGLRAFVGLLGWCAALTASAYGQQPPVYNFDDIKNVGSQSITSIQRVNQTQTVTATLGGPLTVPGGKGQGLVNVTISSGDTSFAGTFAVQSGSGTSTLTWNQPGPDSSGATGTVTATGWGLCLGGSCAGNNAPTTWSQTFNNATPSLDSGGSMLLSETGSGSDAGWFYNAGASFTTGFTLDLQFNIPDNSKIQALEFDQVQYLKGTDGGVSQDTKLLFGAQCSTGNPFNWQVWDGLKRDWVDTVPTVACNYSVSSTAFNHLTIAVHRVAGDTSCTGTTPPPDNVQFTGPHMYYDSITLNGTVVASNQKTCSGPPKSTEEPIDDQTTLFIQLDSIGSCSGCTISEYIDRGTFLPWEFSDWWPAVQSLLVH